MNCPKCGALMEVVSVQGNPVHRCKVCKGLWFEALEREKVARVPGSEAIDSGDPKVGAKFNKMSAVICPNCKTQMIKMVDLKHPHIWYEACEACGGTFFDAGEFKDSKKSSLAGLFKDLFAKERR